MQTGCQANGKLKAVADRILMGDIPRSVIMPVFNERDTVAAVVGRVFSEIPLNLELIVVNDGSTESVGRIIERGRRSSLSCNVA